MIDMSFFKNKNIFLTGHTGFKGTWLSLILANAGANVTGYALLPENKENIFDILGIDKEINSVIGDIRDFDKLEKTFFSAKPDIVLHLAAQPIVRESYNNPRYTYETNVMGTVNICECVRNQDIVKSFLNVTTDKVYMNMEWERGYKEDDVLDGYDPYSNSKSCSELVTHSYKNSFFYNMNVAVSTARAGNVIGGGDFSKDRIIPDCVSAAIKKDKIVVRNPYSIRPYQHVLEPLFAYLMIVKKQYENNSFSGYYNIGPEYEDCITTGKLVDLFCEKWGGGLEWINKHDGGPHEANFLKLDCSKIKSKFGWKPNWNVETAVEKTVEWYKEYNNGGNILDCMNRQIKEYLKNEV